MKIWDTITLGCETRVHFGSGNIYAKISCVELKYKVKDIQMWCSSFYLEIPSQDHLSWSIYMSGTTDNQMKHTVVYTGNVQGQLTCLISWHVHDTRMTCTVSHHSCLVIWPDRQRILWRTLLTHHFCCNTRRGTERLKLQTHEV